MYLGGERHLPKSTIQGAPGWSRLEPWPLHLESEALIIIRPPCLLKIQQILVIRWLIYFNIIIILIMPVSSFVDPRCQQLRHTKICSKDWLRQQTKFNTFPQTRIYWGLISQSVFFVCVYLWQPHSQGLTGLQAGRWEILGTRLMSVIRYNKSGVDPENSERGARVPRPSVPHPPNENFTFRDMQHMA